MTHEESIAEAQRLLLEAGSRRAEVRGSHPYWLVVCDWGVSATSPEDHTFDEPHECAAALVAQWSKSGHDAGHETDSEIVPEGPPDVGDPIWRDPAWASGGGPPDDGSGALSDHGGDDLRPAEPDDAAFLEIAAEGADLDPLLLLPEPEPEDFAPDEIASDEVAEAVAIFGDNLPMQRLLLIGRVTQIAGELKAVLQDGWTVDEFRELQNHIMRMSQGVAPEDEHARARFAAISEASRAMSAIDAHAERQVEWINGASRDEIASYKPEEGWP